MDPLIENTLTLARQGQVCEEPVRVPLDDAVRQAWEPIAGSDAALVSLDLPEAILGDPDRVRELLGNLFQNAVDHGGTGVTVRVGWEEDDGAGIAAEDPTEVFERGYTTGEDGTGLGLTIVQRIAAAHGWEVTVAESAAGGARFELRGVERADA